MAEKIEDLNLPNSNVVRIIKEALPEGVSVGKDARAALARAASVFIIHLTAIATSEARKDNHKSVKVQDILAALEEAEFDSFVEPLKETLETYRAAMQNKKDTKKKEEKAIATETPTDDAVMVSDE